MATAIKKYDKDVSNISEMRQNQSKNKNNKCQYVTKSRRHVKQLILPLTVTTRCLQLQPYYAEGYDYEQQGYINNKLIQQQ